MVGSSNSLIYTIHGLYVPMNIDKHSASKRSLKHIIVNAITYDTVDSELNLKSVHMRCTIHYYSLSVLCTSSAKQVPCADPKNSINFFVYFSNQLIS